MPDKIRLKNDKTIKKHALNYSSKLNNLKLKDPNAFELMMFRISRTKIKTILNDNFKDYKYFKEKGWLESDFYYPAKIGSFKKLFGKFVDKIAAGK